MSGIGIRRGERADIAALQAVEVAAAGRFRSIGWDAVAACEPTPRDVLVDRMTAGRLIVAEANGEPVGFACWSPLTASAYLDEIDVRPDWQGRGAGAALIEAVATAAAAAGFDELVLSTFRSVAWNGPWYARRGFVAIADEAIGPELLAIRQKHIAAGLDESQRQFMRRPLASTARQRLSPWPCCP